MNEPRIRPLGDPWFTDLPKNWQVKAFKRVGLLRNGQVDPRDERFRDLPLYAPNHIESGTGRLIAVETAAEQGADSGKYPVKAGELVYSKIRPALRKIMLAPADGLCSADMYAVRPAPGMDLRFLFWCMLSDGFSEAAVLASDRVAMPKVNRETLADFPVPTAPLSTQRAIADFLDRKTAAIDALIEKKERLIALLAEKRAALIHRAVTKGMNPDVPMKHSGVPWIGEIPAHWEVKRLKFLVTEAVAGPYGSSLTKAMYTSSGYRVYGQQQVIPDDFSVGDYYISGEKYESMRRYEVHPGDFLVSVMGTVGKVAVVPEGVEPGIINPRLVRYHPDSAQVNVRFLQLAMMSEAGQAPLLVAAQGSTMDGLNMGIIGELRVALPPLDEQVRINDETRKLGGQLSALATTAGVQIDKLHEYRQSLITAAVTGQLDIPGEDAA